MLLKSGADVNITDEMGETALHIACRYDNLSLIKLFLCEGASPAAQSNVNFTFILILLRKTTTHKVSIFWINRINYI